MLHRRAADVRPVVRKAAIQALEAILLGSELLRASEGEGVLLCVLSSEDLQVFFDGCMDTSVAIRKQSMQSLSALLLRYPHDSTLQKVRNGVCV